MGEFFTPMMYDAIMCTRKKILCIVILVMVPTLIAYAQKGLTIPRLTPNVVINRMLTVTNAPDNREVFSLMIEDNVLQAEFEVFDADWDFDLYLSSKRNLDDLEQAEFAQINDEHAEKLIINRFWGDGKLTSGTWYLYLVAKSPSDIRLSQRPSSYKVVYRTVEFQQKLITFGIHDGTLNFENGSALFYFFDIPTNIPAFTIAVNNSGMDIDFYLKRDTPILAKSDADIISESYLSNEMITLRESDLGSPLTGRWYLVVTQKPTKEHQDQFKLFVGPGTDVPISFKTIPNPLQPASTDPLINSAYAVVEILHDRGGGSGCLVSSQGHILTNRHVILNSNRVPFKEVAVGMTVNIGRPSVEYFWAEVLWTQEETDLAILQIRRGLYNQPLPSQLRFPFLPFNTGADPSLGSGVWAVGYPYWGGRGTKTSITVSRGVIAGFEDTRFGRVYKIDASINHGSSGGAVLNEQYQLIAIPTVFVYDSSGQLGFAHPIKLIPQEWIQRFGR